MHVDPVRTLGPWSFTIQQDTPVHWVRSGPLDSYLLKVECEVPLIPGGIISTGLLLHSGESVLGVVWTIKYCE